MRYFNWLPLVAAVYFGAHLFVFLGAN